MISAFIYDHALSALTQLGVIVILLRQRQHFLKPWLLPGVLLVQLAYSISMTTYDLQWSPQALSNALAIARNGLWAAFLSSFLPKVLYTRKSVTGPETVWKIMLALTAMALSVYGAAIAMDLSSLPVVEAGCQIILLCLILVLSEQALKNAWREKNIGLFMLVATPLPMFIMQMTGVMGTLFYEGIPILQWFNRQIMSALCAAVVSMIVFRAGKRLESLQLKTPVLHTPLVLLGCVLWIPMVAALSYLVPQDSATERMLYEYIAAICDGFLLATLVLKGFQWSLKKALGVDDSIDQYDWREAWSRFSSLLSKQESQLTLAERVVYAMGTMIGSESGLLFEADKNNFVLSASWGLSDGGQESSVLPEALSGFYQTNPHVVERSQLEQVHRQWFDEHWPRMSLFIPLVYNNVLVGVLCLKKPPADFFLSQEVLTLLKTAGTQAAVCLALHQNAQALSHARQFEGFNRLSTFMMHDVKNIIMQLSLTLSNAQKHRDNPEFIESMLKTINASVQHLQQMVRQLQLGQSKQTEDITPVEIMPILEAVVSQRAQLEPTPQWINPAQDEKLRVLGNANQFRSVIQNLLHNAQQATDRSGRVKLTTQIEGNWLKITIEDTGCGMSDAFIKDGLFNPFTTTKGSYGMGIGVYEAKAYMHATGGKIHVKSTVGKGTCFTLKCPLAARMCESVS